MYDTVVVCEGGSTLVGVSSFLFVGGADEGDGETALGERGVGFSFGECWG